MSKVLKMLLGFFLIFIVVAAIAGLYWALDVGPKTKHSERKKQKDQPAAGQTKSGTQGQHQ